MGKGNGRSSFIVAAVTWSSIWCDRGTLFDCRRGRTESILMSMPLAALGVRLAAGGWQPVGRHCSIATTQTARVAVTRGAMMASSHCRYSACSFMEKTR